MTSYVVTVGDIEYIPILHPLYQTDSNMYMHNNDNNNDNNNNNHNNDNNIIVISNNTNNTNKCNFNMITPFSQ